MMAIGDNLKHQMRRHRLSKIRETEEENMKIFRRLYQSQSHYNLRKVIKNHDENVIKHAQRASAKTFVLSHSPTAEELEANDKNAVRLPAQVTHEQALKNQKFEICQR